MDIIGEANSMLLPRYTKTGSGSNFKFYYYEPSMAAACIFIVLFGLATLGHAFRLFHSRTWYMFPFLVGCIFETIGYVGRALSAHENPGPYSLGPYLIQALLILVAPALLAASLYMEVGRVVVMIQGDAYLPMRRNRMTFIFVCGDIISFIVQAGGAGILSDGKAKDANLGKYVVSAGLIIQIISFGFFVLVASTFHRRVSRASPPLALQRPWKRHMFALYVVSVMIFVRSVVRCAEFLQGYTGYIYDHEVFLYVFDGTVIWSAVMIMLWVHPGQVARYVRGTHPGAAREEAQKEGALGQSV